MIIASRLRCILGGITLFIFSCTTDNPVIAPDLPKLLSGITSIPEVSTPFMEGVYEVVKGQQRFGETIVVKWYGRKLSLLSKNCYAVLLNTGLKDSTIVMQGFWRAPTSDGTGITNFFIAKSEGARNILKSTPTTSITMRGEFGFGNSPPNAEVEFKYLRPFSAAVKAKDFFIIAHRGGGRTSDRLPVSENSIPMVGYAEYLGSNAIEVDIRLTKDKIPILYHDEDINIRLTTKGPLNGPISNFTMDQLSTFVRLIRGEKIPKLDDVLDYVVDSTRLEFVWLDMKESTEALNLVIPIQDRILKKAQSKGRKLSLLVGVPTQDVLNGLKDISNFQSIPSLCEISPETARELNSKAWAPRWTLGTQNDLVAQVQTEGRKVFCWTIDSPDYIRTFIEEGIFDGLLSNYPSTVAYYHYIKE
jgi:glycerophosphoryl diester phosphodiesterase